MFRLIIISLSFILLFTLSVTAQDKKENKKEINREKFDPAKNPFDDLKAAVAKAKETNKRIILDVGGEWCIWCHRMDEFIETTPELKEYISSNYIIVKVNYSPENKNEVFLKQYPKIDGYPHIFVLDKNGKFIHSQNTGELESGKGYDKEKYLSFLKKWSGE